MFQSRVIKLITVFALSFCCILCNTVYSFAYFPIVKVEPDEFLIESSTCDRIVYPDYVPSFTLSEKVFAHSEHNGEVYYASKFGSDTTIDLAYSVSVPTPLTTFKDSSVFVLFRIGSTFYYYYYMSEIPQDFHIETVMDDNGYVDYFNFTYTLSSIINIRLYSCSYPYDTWKEQYNKNSNSSQFGTEQRKKWFDNVSKDNFEFYWSNLSVQGFTNDNGIYKDYYTIVYSHNMTYYEAISKKYNIINSRDVYLFAGYLQYNFTKSEIHSLIMGESCFLLSDLGVIFGSYSSIALAFYEVLIYHQSGALLKTITLFANNLVDDGPFDGVDLGDYPVGSSRFHNVISFEMLDMYQHEAFELSPEDYYSVKIRVQFASDGYNLFFPGTLEIVKFQDYEEDMKHSEVVDSINQATGSITGSISSASDKLSQEITGAISDLGSDINEHLDVKFDELMYGDVPYDKPVYNSELDDVNSDIDSTIDDILSNLDSKALENLPGGYLTYGAYFTDSIDTLNTQFAPAFMAVRNIFDRLVNVTDIGVLLTFSLIFGFSIFVLGRRLKQ